MILNMDAMAARNQGYLSFQHYKQFNILFETTTSSGSWS
ncbi:hypothetical protein Pint_22140 [Pistacia integerrima]|uniref:Uncharacterized protein n=1 Tax=Pistacia integerrima TaxID=434235 RepID=A0ACC0YIJ6_9ROSI|nr:hypothetical protein Pint_22140 [Pistacia integerrima]